MPSMIKLNINQTNIVHQEDGFQIRIMSIGAKQSIPMHYHNHCKDLIVGLHGEAQLLCNDQYLKINAGDAFLIRCTVMLSFYPGNYT